MSCGPSAGVVGVFAGWEVGGHFVGELVEAGGSYNARVGL